MRRDAILPWVNRLLRRHRPAYCLSFTEPGVATFINVMNCPTKLVSVAARSDLRGRHGVRARVADARAEVGERRCQRRPRAALRQGV